MKYGIMICCLLSYSLLNSQEVIKVNERVAMDMTNPPVVWIDSMRTDMAHLVMDRSDIDSMHVMKDSATSKKYSRVLSRGSLIIFPKAAVELVRLPAFLEQKGVPANDRNLRVCINKTLVRHPALLLIQPEHVKTIEITSEHHWLYPEQANNKELFLNIITKEDPVDRLN